MTNALIGLPLILLIAMLRRENVTVLIKTHTHSQYIWHLYLIPCMGGTPAGQVLPNTSSTSRKLRHLVEQPRPHNLPRQARCVQSLQLTRQRYTARGFG
jgi:hypothetical protein